MTTQELRNTISEIIGRPVTLKLRNGVSRCGEVWAQFVAIYGDILIENDGEYIPMKNESLGYDYRCHLWCDKLVMAAMRLDVLFAQSVLRGKEILASSISCSDWFVYFWIT